MLYITKYYKIKIKKRAYLKKRANDEEAIMLRYWQGFLLLEM